MKLIMGLVPSKFPRTKFIEILGYLDENPTHESEQQPIARFFLNPILALLSPGLEPCENRSPKFETKQTLEKMENFPSQTC
jgi:hypothetical protein